MSVVAVYPGTFDPITNGHSDLVQRAAIAQRHAHHVFLRSSGRLLNGLGHFARLAMTETDAALLIADDDEGCETEVLAALHNFGHTVDVDNLVNEL